MRMRWKRINKGIKHMITRWLSALWGLNSSSTSGLRWWPNTFQDTGVSVLHLLTPQFTVPTTCSMPPTNTDHPKRQATTSMLILICNDFREMFAASIAFIAHKLKIPDSNRWHIGYWQRNHKQIEISHWSTVAVPRPSGWWDTRQMIITEIQIEKVWEGVLDIVLSWYY